MVSAPPVQFCVHYSDLARRHLEVAEALLSCTCTTLQSRYIWARIAATAAAVSAADAYLEIKSPKWRTTYATTGRSKATRIKEFEAVAPGKVSRMFNKLCDLGYDDRYNPSRQCAIHEAKIAIANAIFVLNETCPGTLPAPAITATAPDSQTSAT